MKNKIVGYALAMVVVGYLFVEWILMASNFGLTASLFTLVFILYCWFFFKEHNKKLSRESYWYLSLIAIVGLSFTIISNQFVDFLKLMFLMCLVIYWILVVTGKRVSQFLDLSFFLDGINGWIILPLSNFGEIFKVLFTKRSSSDNKVGLTVFLALLVSIPISFLLIVLLGQSDVMFAKLIENIRFDSEFIIEFIFKGILTCLVAAFLFGLLVGSVSEKEVGLVDIKTNKFRCLSTTFVVVVLLPIIVIFITYLGSQFGYLTMAFTGEIPNGLTYAEFGRQGFFELIFVAIVNLFLIEMAVKLRIGKTSKVVKWELSFIVGFTIFLIISAMMKMALYIDVYGLTFLRVTTIWVMLMFLTIFGLILVKLLKQQFAYSRWIARIIVGFSVVFLISSIDALVVDYNVNAYMKGNLPTYEIDSLRYNGNSGILGLIKIYRNSTGAIRNEAKEILDSLEYTIPIANYNVGNYYVYTQYRKFKYLP